MEQLGAQRVREIRGSRTSRRSTALEAGSCDRLWRRLGIDRAIIAAVGGRRLDAEAVERTIFAMVANRLSVKPLSKLAGCGWVAERAHVAGLPGVNEDACYRAMDVLLDVLAGYRSGCSSRSRRCWISRSI